MIRWNLKIPINIFNKVEFDVIKVDLSAANKISNEIVLLVKVEKEKVDGEK